MLKAMDARSLQEYDRGSRPILKPMALALAAAAAAPPAHAQTLSLADLRAAVQSCVKEVREEARQPENYQFGQLPMWKDFDAFVSPDGLVYNNATLNREMDGVFRFRKCLAKLGFSLKISLLSVC